MANTIFPKISWIEDDDIIEILNIVKELRLGYESNEKYLKNKKSVNKRVEKMGGSCSLNDLKDLSEVEENIFSEYINNFSKQNSRFTTNGTILNSELLNKYGRKQVSIRIERTIECEIEASFFYSLSELDSEPNKLDIMSFRENIIRENEILFSLLGSYHVHNNKEPISLGYFLTSYGEKIKPSLFQKLKMLAK